MKIEIEKPVVPQWFDDWYKTFKGNKTNALYFLNRIGWGHGLVDYNDKEVKSYPINLFNIIEAYDNYDSVKEYLSKAILHGYVVEPEPLYYAKIKGWERIGTSSYYFGYDEENDSLEITYLESNYSFAFSLTMKHWNKLGINEINADFKKVEG